MELYAHAISLVCFPALRAYVSDWVLGDLAGTEGIHAGRLHTCIVQAAGLCTSGSGCNEQCL